MANWVELTGGGGLIRLNLDQAIYFGDALGVYSKTHNLKTKIAFAVSPGQGVGPIEIAVKEEPDAVWALARRGQTNA